MFPLMLVPFALVSVTSVRHPGQMAVVVVAVGGSCSRVESYVGTSLALSSVRTMSGAPSELVRIESPMKKFCCVFVAVATLAFRLMSGRGRLNSASEQLRGDPEQENVMFSSLGNPVVVPGQPETVINSVAVALVQALVVSDWAGAAIAGGLFKVPPALA